MIEEEIVIANGILSIFAAVGFLIMFVMLVWSMRTENGITGALALREFALLLSSIWSVALLFNWFPNRMFWLQTRLLSLAFLVITLAGLGMVLVVTKVKK